jgi:hypothetical protein
MSDPTAYTKTQFDERENGPVDHGVPAVIRFPLAFGPGLQGTRVNVTEPGAYWLQVDYDTDTQMVVVEFKTEAERRADIRRPTSAVTHQEDQ